ncbi:MAG: 3-dehydroquinate synthetase [Hyphomicrobiaceae bacterium]|jgi:3-dehydroquinate synthetase
MIAECRAANVDVAITNRIGDLLQAIGVDTHTPTHLADAEQLWELARQDKKAMRGQVPMYVPIELGKGAIVNLTAESLTAAMHNPRTPS